MNIKVFLFPVLLLCFAGFAQPRIIAGPMLGQVEYMDAKVWVEVSPQVKAVSILYAKKGSTVAKTINYKGILGNEYNPIQFSITSLDVNTKYQYSILIDKKPTKATGEFTTKDLWQHRKPAPDFSFLTGSCHFSNERIYDRPGTPYGGDSTIFNTMAKEKAAFMLWLGDSWYTREVDFFSEWGLRYRASHDRANPGIQNFLKAMPQFAIWDDHDYGPNNFGSNYILKETSRDIWKKYWCNPSCGFNNQGTYTMASYSDVDVFMTDDRWFRSSDRLKDSINGLPNADKYMLGHEQMQWLKNSLLNSYATFKIIAVGSQVLNPVSTSEKWKTYLAEYKDFMNFLHIHNISGVVFLTGDRHHSEIIKIERTDNYPLYDITVSPLTSGTHPFGESEKNNPCRIVGVDQKQNYGRFTISGSKGERVLKVEFLGLNGNKINEWSVSEKKLKKQKN